jgi:GMP synthase (glutamine-hydrolysing)
MPKRVVLIAHNDDPRDDRVMTHLVRAGYAPEVRKPFRGEPLGEPGDIAGTVLYGGPFTVFETARHPFLAEEYRWIEACLKADVPMLGICQGAQQIAWHLGGGAGPYPEPLHEFGYYEIRPVPGAEDFLPQPLRVSQSHWHTFGIPAGAVRLAESDFYPNQAMRYGTHVYAFQFHAEVTIEGFRRWQTAPGAAFGKPGAQTREEQTRLMHAHDAAQADWFYGFLGKLFPAVTA